ncbi:Xaa-Pro peptidase family protein [Mesorhizobium sp.]|nr:Xaa-Pro peptidase family protein [Mesorhizobium sp.]RWJ31942.1 MAG: aminopeptidase P family protein [Mesorhizobium sp.]
MPIFSKNEINRRLQRFRSQFGECDVGIGFSFTNSYYLSGAPIMHSGRPTITVVPKHGEPVIVIAEIEKGRALLLSPIKDFRSYTDDDGPNVEAALRILVDVLKDLKAKNVGYDANWTPAATINLLKTLLPELEFTDLSSVFDGMRLVNSDEEIEIVRASSAIADVGMQAFLSEAKIGMREIELAGISMRAMTEFAGRSYPDTEVKVSFASQQGLRSLQAHGGTNGEPLSSGQLMCVVTTAFAWSYNTAVERVVALGDLNPEQERLRDALILAHRSAIDAVAPGVACSAVDNVARKIFTAAGFTQVHCGTGLARGVQNDFEGRIDRGNIRSYNHAPLLPGMAITIEPWAIVPGVGAPRNCDMVLVTDTGHEVLTKTPAGKLRIG